MPNLSLRATVVAIEVAAVNGSTALSTGPHSLCPRKPSHKWCRVHVSEFGGSKLSEHRASGTYVLYMKSGVLRLIFKRRLVPGPKGACFCESVASCGCSSGSSASYPHHVLRFRPLLQPCRRPSGVQVPSLPPRIREFERLHGPPTRLIKILRRHAMPYDNK